MSYIFGFFKIGYKSLSIFRSKQTAMFLDFKYGLVIFQHEHSISFQMISNPILLLFSFNKFAQTLQHLAIFDFLNKGDAIRQIFFDAFTGQIFNHFNVDIPAVLAK